MEKFTVDLDKVLDDFEFNEDKAEQLASVVPKKQPTQPIVRVKQVVTPYRRPQFEPINIAEADFAAAPEKSYHSNWQASSKPTENPQTWRVKNNEESDEEMDSGEDSDIEGDDSYKIPVPKNLNESLNFYQNNSFQDEFLENKPIPVTSRSVSFQEQDTKWQPKSQNILDSSESYSSGKSNVSVGATSVNDNKHSGAKVIVKDVKTVSNNLSSNKLTNRGKSVVPESRTTVEREPDRNLPDVASTSKVSFQNVAPSVPNNTTFDLVTNICNEQDQSFYEDKSLPSYLSSAKPIIESLTIVSSPETSEDEYDPESSQSHVFKPYELRVPATTAVSTAERDKKTESSSDDEELNPSSVAESSQNVDFTCATVESPVVRFGEVDHLSDSDLLNYLQEIEDEENVSEESKVKVDDLTPMSKGEESQNRSEKVPEVNESWEESTVTEIPSETSSALTSVITSVVKDPNETKEDAAEVVLSAASKVERELEVTVEDRRTTSNMLKEIVFEMSLPECSIPPVDETEAVVQQVADVPAAEASEESTADTMQHPGLETRITGTDPEGGRQVVLQEAAVSEPEDSSPEDEESMDCDNRTYAGISAETGRVIELTPDAERPGLAVDEVRSPMIQTARDGSNIHVLGEEERPTRPKYLLLSNVASALDETPSAVGPAGNTPSAYTSTNINAINQNLINANLDGSQTVDQEDPGQTPEAGLDCGDVPVNDSNVELLDNMINANTIDDQGSDEYRAAEDLLTPEERSLGKLPPFWIPDHDAAVCMLCDVKFTVIKRRHHCRACGKVLCGKCCGLRFRLEYMDNTEGRVCQPCYDVLLKVLLDEQGEGATGSPHTPVGRQPNPNNPMEYCSVIPPLQQQATGQNNPPCVLVPVLKREGSSRPKGDGVKQVMFSDGIRPGGDLTELDGSAEPRLPFRRPGSRVAKRVATPPGAVSPSAVSRTLPALNAKTLSYLPHDKAGLPPMASIVKGELKLDDDSLTQDQLLTRLTCDSEPPVMFAINRNLFVNVKILNLSCCVNRVCWCFSTRGLSSVGQDEVLLILEKPEQETTLPTDVFSYINTLYQDAVRGSTVSELGCTLLTGPFLGSNDHGAFIYIRPSFQCLNQLVLPNPPYLVAVLVHRCETPWARVFPIRLMLRLGAEFRYYPCSLVSIRQRKAVYREIGHTIMNLLADFRNLSYTLPAVRGLVIHMEDRQTSILLPRNRYDQVTRALSNSNEHVLAFAANLSLTADSHLVCVQSDNDDSYHTQAINIHSKPRKVTGASFVVFNGALKTSSNLTAKSSIVEDGLMVQITPDTMLALRAALRNMKELSIGCGPTGAEAPDEVVKVKWVDDDKHFNVGVASVIDGRNLDGVPSIRVHNGTDYLGRCRLVRWTEVFILQSDESSGTRTEDPLDVGRLSESIARATCHALVKLLDLLAQADYTKLAVRATIHPDNVGYEVGSRGEKLPPIYMNSLDNELVPVLHTAAASNQNTDAVLELVFHVLLQ